TNLPTAAHRDAFTFVADGGVNGEFEASDGANWRGVRDGTDGDCLASRSAVTHLTLLHRPFAHGVA
ncbi:MAG: hypothetical protein AAFX02_10175, partial [Pseudomonadota bacterium]